MAQLKSTNITGNLAVTGNTLASKIIKLGGTTHELLLADGSVANISTTAQTVAPNAVTATSGRTYLIQKKDGQLVVNVPWNSGTIGALTEIQINSGTGLSGGGSIDTSGGSVTLNHSNSVTAVTTAGLLKLKYDTEGHITGTTAVTKTDITGLGIPSSDTGATSIEVVGTGNAVTNASYDATSRKITLTKGSTFLTSHQSLAAYVKGPASSTDNAVARFDSTTGKVIQNSRTTIDDTGNLKINNSDGGDIGLTLGRGSNADWRLFGSNGNFYIQGNYTTSKQTSFYSVLTLAYNSGNATVKGSVTADGFKHSNSTTGTNDYVLLAGGGTKSLSDFGTGSGNVSGSGLTADCIVLGNGSSSIKTSSKTIATTVGTDDTTVPTSKAVKDYVTGLGYITGSYLPLAGGTMTGAIKYAGATREIISFAPDDATWRGGLKYSWSSNTTIGLWGKHVNSQFVWHAGTDFASADVNGTTTRTYDFQVGRDVRSGGSGNLEALLGGKPLATQEWVENLGYVTGSYLPLSGGTMTGAITLPENKMALKFRTHATSYETGLVYGTTGNEALTFAIQNPVTAFQIVYGTKPSAYGSNTWQSVTPLFQTKDGKVIINRKITTTADTTNLKLLDVNGDIGANGIFVNNITCGKILAPTTSGGTTYGVGTNGQVLKSNGTTVYWGTDSSGSGSDQKTSSSNQASTKLLIVGAQSASTSGVTTYTNSGCYIGTDNCLYSNGKKVATEEWVETAIKDKISSVKIYSEVRYDANGDVNNAYWTPGWREDTGSWDPSIITNNSSATYTTTGTITSSNQTVTLRRPYSSQSSHSRWVMVVTASGMHGLSISGATATTIENNKYKIQFAAKTPQTITLSKGEATFVIQVQFQTASYQD